MSKRGEYDFIVVGSGPSGSSVASRLASAPASPSILLLEAGAAKDSANADILAERWTAVPSFPRSVENHSTVPQASLNKRAINYARGKVLGGSSAINMCAYTVGPKDDYERWADMVNDASFGWEHTARIRSEKLERAVTVSMPKVSDWERPMMLQLDAAKASGLGYCSDINSGNPLGLASAPSTARCGYRMTAAKAYLENAPSNLTILTEQHVTKVLFEGKKAIGVLTANGDEYTASKEVILSAGAVDTPKLLMLSGIGDSDELTKHSIAVLHHLPGVGKNLQDHLSLPLCWKQKEALVDWPQHFSNPDRVKAAREQFLKNGTGPLSIFFQGLTMGFFKADEVLGTDEFNRLDEDVKKHLMRPTVPIWELSCHIPPVSPNALSAPEDPYLTIFCFLHDPQSRGKVTLSSPSPTSPPLINPNFFTHPFDRVCALAATKRTLAFIQHPLISSNILCPVDVPASSSDEDIIDFWEKNAASTWHPACTVRMGRDGDEDACVDSNFRVKGVDGLRVVDLSVLPFLLSCHPVSVAYLVGEIAAEKIVKEYGLDV